MSSSTNLPETNPMGLSYMGLVPCSCQCWHGPKAPKITTFSSSVRANAAPYLLNTTNSSTGSMPCAQCKLKKEHEQRQQLQMQQHQLNQLNCSHHNRHHQIAAPCHCQINQSVKTPLLTFPVPPPPLPSAVPTFMTTTSQTPSSNILMTTPSPNINANNQMYFVPFGVPGMMPGTTTTSSAMPVNQLPMSNYCRHHPPPSFPPSIKPSNVKPIGSSQSSSTTSSMRSTASIPTVEEKDNNDDASDENGDQETIMAYDDYEDEETTTEDNVKRTTGSRRI